MLPTGRLAAVGCACLLTLASLAGCDPGDSDVARPRSPTTPAKATRTRLPQPQTRGGLPLQDALAQRRSVREYGPDPLTIGQVGQLLWAAQGVTSGSGGRTAPSAGALYPLETYVALPDAVHHYEPAGHLLVGTSSGDVRAALSRAALGQEAVARAPGVFVIAGVAARTRAKYGDRAERYVHLEAGHAAQNLLLQAVALGLAAVPIGAFDDAGVREVLELPAGEQPLYLIPVGIPKRTM